MNLATLVIATAAAVAPLQAVLDEQRAAQDVAGISAVVVGQGETLFLGASGVETYHLMTNFPVNSIEDLKGRKILAPGPSANWIKHLGAVPVNGALPTYYNQVQTGVADGLGRRRRSVLNT